MVVDDLLRFIEELTGMEAAATFGLWLQELALRLRYAEHMRGVIPLPFADPPVPVERIPCWWEDAFGESA